MRSVKLSTVLVVLGVSVGMVFLSGCSTELQDLKTRNQTQQARITDLEAQLQTAQLQLADLTRQLEAANATGGVEVDALRQKVAALEEDIAKKKALIESMQANLMGVSPLPVELNTALEDFARGSDMIEYDASKGLVKFKSDLLFERGSDDVTSTAAEAVKTLCGILNTDTAKQFHVVVAGHTDDMPIQRPQTKADHPTNRHLSSHRAIAVVEVMEKNGVEPTRLSTRGFGEYRTVEPNAAGKRGNPKNRRVEIYIVPAGA
jgi:chemotaxis protein MotB